MKKVPERVIERKIRHPAPVAVVLSPSWASVPVHFHGTTARALLGQLIPELQKRGRPVWLLVPGKLPSEHLFGAEVRCLNLREFPGKKLWPRLNALFLGWQAGKFLKAKRIRAAHLFAFYKSADALMFLAARKLARVEYLISRQTLPAQVGPAANGSHGSLMNALHAGAAAVAAPSRLARDECAAAFPALDRSRIHVVPNGVNVDFFGRAVNGRTSEKRKRAPFLLTVARQSPYKGHDLLVWSFFDILQKGGEIDLVICGMDHAQGHISRLVRQLKLEKRVRFVGQVDTSQVKGLLDECICFVLASRLESFGMAALEAMAAGKPVVVSRGAGVAELIRDGVDGLLVNAGDPKELTEKLWRLIRDGDLRDRLGKNARVTAARYSWEAIARDLDVLYDRISAGPR